MKALILNDYGEGQNYATLVYLGIKTIETRMNRLFSYRGDIVICKGKTNSIGDNKGMALCIVNIYHGRDMKKSDESAACIQWHKNRKCLLLNNWRYFSDLFEFTKYATSYNWQGIFDVDIPRSVSIIPQPQITGFQEQITQTQLF
jgi:hypothetical protein